MLVLLHDIIISYSMIKTERRGLLLYSHNINTLLVAALLIKIGSVIKYLRKII